MVMREFELKRSRALLAAVLAMASLAGVSIVLAELPGWVRASLATVLASAVLYFLYAWRKALPRIRIQPNGQVQLRYAAEEWQTATPLPGSYVSSSFSVVRLRARQITHKLVLLPDSAARDDLRALRLSLRWAPRTRSDTAFPGAG